MRFLAYTVSRLVESSHQPYPCPDIQASISRRLTPMRGRMIPSDAGRMPPSPFSPLPRNRL